MTKYQIYAWIGILFLLFSCAETDEKLDGMRSKRSVRFNLSAVTASVEEGGTLSRSVIDNSREITQLWCAILDSKENIVRTYHLTGEQTKKFYLEDVEVGKYSAIFMATTGEISANAPALEDITRPWITNLNPARPFEEDYLYKRVEFTVTPDNSDQTLDVSLPRLTGRVEVQLASSNPLIQQLITKIEIVFDPGTHVHTAMLGNGTYTGDGVLDPIDITQDKGFFSLPGENLSGKVIITQQRSYDNAETFLTEYPFTALNILPGTISPIKLSYSHPEEEYGEIRVSESVYNTSNSITMFLNSEPSSVINARSFKVDSPLKVGIDTSNKQLVTSFFAPLEIRDTKVLIKFKRYSEKFFYLAHYDVIHPFQESRMDIPVMSRRCKFTAEDGEQVWVPAQEDLSWNNCELKIVYPDTEYAHKIKKIKCHWNVFCQEERPGIYRILNATPEMARHICLVAVNMGYMFSTELFTSEFNKLNGLYDNQKDPIDKASVLNKIYNSPKLKLGILEVSPLAQGLAAEGTYVTMYAEHFRNHYPVHSDPAPAMNTPRRTLFHEFGHWLGFTHASNMSKDEVTNNDLWAQFCSRIYHELYLAGELPVSSDIIDSLPR